MNIIQLKPTDIKTLRNKLLNENNICPICNKEITDPVLDHSHKKKNNGTGLIRGVICRTCNVMLGKIENNCTRYKIDNSDLPNVLRNMANYLEQDHLPYIHPSEKKKTKLKKSSYNKLKKICTVKIPNYTGRYTKTLDKLYKKFNLEPEFY